MDGYTYGVDQILMSIVYIIFNCGCFYYKVYNFIHRKVANNHKTIAYNNGNYCLCHKICQYLLVSRLITTSNANTYRTVHVYLLHDTSQSAFTVCVNEATTMKLTIMCINDSENLTCIAITTIHNITHNT